MYENYLKWASQLVDAIECLIDILEERPTDYPLLMRAYAVLVHGYRPRVICECPYCKKSINFRADVVFGGLVDALGEFEEAIKWLIYEQEFDNNLNDLFPKLPYKGECEGGD